MIKKYSIIYTLCCLLLISCQDDNSCLKSAGKAVEKSIWVPSFKNVKIDAGISVEIIQSNTYKVEISSYENRIDQISVNVVENNLLLTNGNSCTLTHRYKAASIKIYTPTLEKIFSNTQFDVYSEKVLTYPDLFIITSINQKNASSSFRLNIDNQKLTIEDNQVGYFQIKGKTDLFDVKLYGGNSRVEAQNLISNKVTFFHRSNNDILLNVINKLEGTIYATGNVVLYNQPEEIDVTQKYTGKIIYK